MVIFIKVIVGKYIITQLFGLLVFSGIIGLAMSIFLFQRRYKNGAIYLAIWSLGIAIWSITYAFEYAATEVALKVFWSKLSYFGIVLCPSSFLLFALAFSFKFKFLKKWQIITLYVVATFFIFTAVTNDMHHLHWKSVSIYTQTNTTHYTYGIFFWLFFIYTYICIFFGIIQLFLLYFKFPERYKSQIVMFILSALFSLAGNIIYVFNINPIPGFDWTPLTFLVSCVILTVNIFRFDVFNLIPIARNKLFDIMPDAVLVVDDSGLIADVNRSMLLYMHKEEKEVLGKYWKTTFPEWEYLSKDFDERKQNKGEFAVQKGDETVYFDFQNTPLYKENGECSGQLVTVRDISSHRNAENRIRNANKQLKKEIVEKEKLIVDLDAFAHTVAHDLKNMLGAIITSTDLLKDSIKNDHKEDAIEILDLIDLSSRKTMHVTQELLLLASVRQQEIKKVSLEMCHIVEEAIKRNANLIKERNAQIIMPDNCLPALGYGPWIEEVWDNYISNAIKYGGNPPVLVFGSKEIEGNMVKYWVKDNGDGITNEQKDLLFSKFTRLELMRVEGNGLGLSIVKRIIEKLDGTVGVESTAIPGEGSLFYFTLPAK